MSLLPHDSDATAEPLFREVQRFTQPWVWAVVALVAALCWGTAVAGFRSGGGGVDWLFVAVFVIGGAIAPALLLASTLTTEVRGDGVYVRFRPFHLRERRFAFEDIENFEARRYSPVWEYGGWGIRMSITGGWVYNVKGNMGVQITMRSGKSILIGSQRPEEFMAAVDAARSANRQRAAASSPSEPSRPRGG